jgi:flagellin
MSIVNYNYASHVAANTINRNDQVMDKTMARIASGTKVGAGHADSGTYALYTNMTVEGKESRAALSNLNSGLARMKLVESTGMAIHKISVRMQELATTASNTLLPDADRYAMDAEFQALLGEWDRLAEQTRFNSNLVMTGTDLVINMGEAGTAANLTVLVDDWRPDAKVAAGGAYTAGEVASGARDTGTANSGGGATFSLSLTSVVSAGAVPATRQENIITAANAALSRAKLDNMTAHLAASVGEVAGDIQALEFAIEAQSGQAVARELGASLIGDTDYATETAKLASQQVVSQAATAILAQANARSATVLTLLK